MKFGKRFISLALALVMIFSLTTGASAASAQNIKVQLSPNITVTYNGKVQSMKDAAGNPVYPLLNGGTTYLPVRAVANMLGINVDWDGTASMVLLSDPAGGRMPADSTDAVGTKPAPSTITVQLSPDIKVKYNSWVQEMTDVNGDPVYPLMYGGTTYLPIRAVSNMLGVAVDWDGATQTVILGRATPFNPKDAVITSTSTIIKVGLGPDDMTEENLRAALTEAGAAEEEIKFCIRSMHNSLKSDGLIFTIDRRPNAEYAYKTEAAPELTYNKFNKSKVEKFTNSKDAERLGENHIGYDYVEIDWSTANDGYIRVKLNKQLAMFTRCTVSTYNALYAENSYKYILPLGKWVNIPLRDGSNEYFVTIQNTYNADEVRAMSKEEWKAIDRSDLTARFKANIKDVNAWLTLSSSKVDYENAPKTQALALELTENCKTDAEKVKAVFDWVSKNIKYDYNLAKQTSEYNAKLAAEQINPISDLFMNGARDSLDLDAILISKSGVCQEYATLTVGMLRSLGIKCKHVSGDVYSNGKWNPHGWVAISPDVTGLNADTFHGWKDENGWVNIDPTNASNTSFTSNAANYKANSEY